jgi:phosphonate transport system ATP-binding protein
MILLADEPVASLDPPTAHQVMRDLRELGREENLLTLINLHFIDMAQEYADRVIGLRAGELVYDGPAKGMEEADFERIYNRKIRPDDLRGAVE